MHKATNTTKLKKVDSNLYKASDDILIKTKNCLVNSLHVEDAIVMYSKFSNDDKIVFLKSEKFCDIDKVFKAE